jgi:hypothetical protein
VRKVYLIFRSVFFVAFFSSCAADTKYEQMDVDASKPQWEEINGGAALPLPAAMDFCGKEATDHSAKIAAVLSLDETYMTGSAAQGLEMKSLSKVQTSEMSKCMLGLGYRKG